MSKIGWIGLLVLLVCSPSWAQQGLLSTVLHDSTRDKEIPVDIFYPSDFPGVGADPALGEFPVVVFGHAMAVPVYSYRHFITALGYEKYIVVLPKTEMTMTPELEEFSKDIAFCADELWRLAQNDPSFLLYRKLDGAFAAVGHSLGGSSSIWAATRTKLFKTVVAFAPPEIEPFPSLAAASLDIPALVMAGTADGVTSMAEHVLPVYKALSSPCKMLISIKGGSHCGFANSNWLCNLGESILAPATFISRKEQHQVTHDYLMPWLKYFMYNTCNQLETMIDSAHVDTRVNLSAECDMRLKPCIESDGDVLQVSASGGLYAWTINGEVMEGESFESISLGYGSGVYRNVVEHDNGCKVFSEEFWYHNDEPAPFGTLQYRVYQSRGEDELVVEVFGTQLPLELSVYDPSGKLVFKEWVNSNRQKLALNGAMNGLMYYVIYNGEDAIGQGKTFIQ